MNKLQKQIEQNQEEEQQYYEQEEGQYEEQQEQYENDNDEEQYYHQQQEQNEDQYEDYQEDEEYKQQQQQEQYNDEDEQNGYDQEQQQQYCDENEENQYYEEDNQQYDQQQQEQEEEYYEEQKQEEQKKPLSAKQIKENYLQKKLEQKLEKIRLPGLMDQNSELDEERRNLWKTFGRETGAGKALFSLYKSHQAPKISYPKVRTKVAEPQVKVKKPCPQQTKIEYPEIKKPPKYKFHQIDFVMRRKPEWEIRKEIDEYFSKKYIPLNRGVNRQQMVKDLQSRFKDQRGALPKGAELPQVGRQDQIEITEQMKAQALKRVSKLNKKFTYNPELDDQSVTGTAISANDPIIELDELFDVIMKEIEERQQYLDSIQHLKDQKQLKEQVKKEMVERVSELQKVTELKKYYKNKQNSTNKN